MFDESLTTLSPRQNGTFRSHENSVWQTFNESLTTSHDFHATSSTLSDPATISPDSQSQSQMPLSDFQRDLRGDVRQIFNQFVQRQICPLESSQRPAFRVFDKSLTTQADFTQVAVNHPHNDDHVSSPPLLSYDYCQ